MLNPGLEAKTPCSSSLQRKYPGHFADGQLRTLQRQIRRWRATAGPAREVFFAQVHEPGRLAASDFTHMTSLAVMIAGQALEHLIYHFVLTYSNWETVTVWLDSVVKGAAKACKNVARSGRMRRNGIARIDWLRR